MTNRPITDIDHTHLHDTREAHRVWCSLLVGNRQAMRSGQGSDLFADRSTEMMLL